MSLPHGKLRKISGFRRGGAGRAQVGAGL